MSQFLEALIKLLELYHSEPELLTAILDLFRDMAEKEIGYLKPDQAAGFMRWCVKLVEQFGKVSAGVCLLRSDVGSHADLQRLGKLKHLKAVSASGHKATDEKARDLEEEHLGDVETLLTLLHHIIQLDSFDVGTPEGRAIAGLAADAVLHGLTLLVPHVSDSLLAFPKIAELYFGLLRELVVAHADKFAALPLPVRDAFLSSLMVGIASHSTNIARDAFQTLSAIGIFHVKGVWSLDDDTLAPLKPKTGRTLGKKTISLVGSSESKAPAVASPTKADGSPTHSALDKERVRAFQLRLLNTLLFQPHLHESLLGPLADALFPLIVNNMEQYVESVNRLVSEWRDKQKPPPSAEQLKKLHDGFQQLLTANQLQAKLSRGNMHIFRQNVKLFVENVRSFVHVR